MNDQQRAAMQHYEAALKAAFPEGATGEVFNHWNEARKALAQPQCEPVAFKQGNLASFTQDTYLALGGMFVQLWDGDDVAARVYGDTIDQIQQRIDRLNTTPPSVEAAIEATKEKAAKEAEFEAARWTYSPDIRESCESIAAAIRSMK